jgi:hypothetical protein
VERLPRSLNGAEGKRRRACRFANPNGRFSWAGRRELPGEVIAHAGKTL